MVARFGIARFAGDARRMRGCDLAKPNRRRRRPPLYIAFKSPVCAATFVVARHWPLSLAAPRPGRRSTGV
jgi:hypothetical protein